MIAPRFGQGSHVFHLVKNVLSFVLANNLSQDTAHDANVGAERSILMRRCCCTAAAATDGTTRRSRGQELSKQGGIGFGKRRIGGKGSSPERRRQPAWLQQDLAWHRCPLCRSSQSNVPCRRLGGSHVCDDDDNGGTTTTTTTTVCGSCDCAPHRPAAQTPKIERCCGEVCVFQSVTQRRELLVQTQPVTSNRTAHTLVDCMCTMVCACCLSLSRICVLARRMQVPTSHEKMQMPIWMVVDVIQNSKILIPFDAERRNCPHKSPTFIFQRIGNEFRATAVYSKTNLPRMQSA
jgi:hypothetical protein